MGTGTTAVVAKKYKRKWIGIEKEKKYINEAKKRINNSNKVDENLRNVKIKKNEPRIPFGSLLEKGLI